MRKIVTFLVLLLAGAGSAWAATGTTQIYQQRTADGRIVLTDHPSAVATTERSWRLEAEDPVAARQRALDVKLEARQVSERVARQLEQQQRLADEQARIRLARADEERAAYDNDQDSTGVLFAPAAFRGGRIRFLDDHHGGSHRGGHGHGMAHGGRLRGSAPLESR